MDTIGIKPARSTTSIRVMIVEDSATISRYLGAIINQDPRLRVVATASSGEEAIQLLHRIRPDVICLDIRLPGMNGFEVARRVMSDRPTPIVVCSAAVEHEELKISMNALRAGALAVVEKPVGTTHRDYEAVAERLCSQLTLMSQVRLIRQRPGLQKKAGKPKISVVGDTGTMMPTASLDRSGAPPIRAIGMAASTGGPAALALILKDLPESLPAPIMLVQHMMPSFLGGFVEWLNELTPLSVSVARSGDVPEPGHVYVAPADRHLEVRGGRMWPTDDPPVSGHRPSGSVLLRSMAQDYGPTAVGVVLTGMGCDGADGLAAIRRAGGYTIAEHESTAVVYGMPAVAVELGAAIESLPCHELSSRLIDLTTCVCAEV